MAKKRMRSIFKAVNNFFSPLQSKQPSEDRFHTGPALEPYPTQRLKMAQTTPSVVSRRGREDLTPTESEADKMNRDRIEQAKLAQAYEQMAQSREALNLTLRSQQRLLVATLIAALVALMVGVISLIDKPPVVNIAPPAVKVDAPEVNVQPPTINVQPPDVRVYTTPQ